MNKCILLFNIYKYFYLLYSILYITNLPNYVCTYLCGGFTIEWLTGCKPTNLPVFVYQYIIVQCMRLEVLDGLLDMPESLSRLWYQWWNDLVIKANVKQAKSQSFPFPHCLYRLPPEYAAQIKNESTKQKYSGSRLIFPPQKDLN